jgi:TIR domain
LWRQALRSIFINYRRNDSEGEAGRLFDDLATQFSQESVFMDVAAIEPGQDFRKAIDKSVATCSILLALVGQEWLQTKDATGRRRLDDETDFVRLELALALQRDIPVIPVLVRGAKMPLAEHLPEDLKELAFRNAVELTHARWKSDVAVLIRALRPYMDPMTPDHIATDASKPETTAAAVTSSLHPVAATPATSALDEELTKRIGKELAAYIGPIAAMIAKRTAKRHTSIEQFCVAIAGEIENETDRAKFLKICRSFAG